MRVVALQTRHQERGQEQQQARKVSGVKELTVPGVVELQVHRDNICSELASRYFQRSVKPITMRRRPELISRERFSDSSSFSAFFLFYPSFKQTETNQDR